MPIDHSRLPRFEDGARQASILPASRSASAGYRDALDVAPTPSAPYPALFSVAIP
ncbi:MAG: hypothetical protein HN919_07415 [Verrucomicrobia bacterium]|jgi:hypothetical protein|nr:hypothetical protein [Verrucomicrobiota bacterium]MBT7066115.1 hypothetical protein [Verrucomicrobiota bacterium]MBT7700764.1 hypothetical protein [Verrucomicrobiota bacterium]